tara:strand:- start:626 stop:1216 length:591 start_codon:yes stop_codon:yes gene_type:complete
MNDWKKQLREVAAVIRKQQKNKKSPKSKFDELQNFRGRKGFSDVGIALTEKTIKQQRKNKAAYKGRYTGSRLNFINDARAEAARQKRLDNPEHKKRIDTMFKIADERIEVEDKKLEHQRRLDSFRFTDPDFKSGGSTYITGKPYSELYRSGFNDKKDESVEFTDYDLAAAGSSVINPEPEFKNKVEEDIWRLKNRK